MRFQSLVCVAAQSAVVLLILASPGLGQPPEASPDSERPAAPAPQSRQPDLGELNLEQLLDVPAAPATRGSVSATPTTSGSTILPGSDAASVTTTGELLERAPSVSVRRTSAINLDPRVRGFNPSQINANANGMTQLKTRIDIDSQFSQIDPGNVQSLEVTAGPYTSLYGPGFAFLRADLVAPQRYQHGLEFHGSLNFWFANNGRQIYNRERLWGGDADWGFDVSYGLRTGEDYRSGGDPGQLRIPASYRQDDVYFAYSQDVTSCYRVDFNYLRLNLYNVELPGVAYDINGQETDQFNVRLVRQDDPSGPEQLVLQFWHARTRYDGDSSRLAKQQSFSAFLIWEAVPALTGGILLSNGVSESSGFRALATLGERCTPQLTIGLDWRRYAQRYQEINIGADGEIGFGGDFFGIPYASQEDIGVLVHWAFPVDPALKLTLGGRLDYVSSYIDRDDIIVLRSDFIGGYRPGFEQPSKVLGMLYVTSEVKPADHWTISASVGMAQRMPNLAELYSDEPYVPLVRFGNSFVDGNSRLIPETNLQCDLGLRGEWEALNFSAAAFYATVYDYILAVPSTFGDGVPLGVDAITNLQRDISAFRPFANEPNVNLAASTHQLAYQYTNINRASFYGGELAGEIRLCRWLGLNGSLAYVKATNHDPIRFIEALKAYVPVKGAEALPNIYPLNGQIGVRIFDPAERDGQGRWSIEFVARMVNGQYYVADSLGELTTPGFTVFNIYGYYQWSESLRFRTSIENLFDRDYAEHGSLVIANPLTRTLGFVREPGFTWTVGVEVRF